MARMKPALVAGVCALAVAAGSVASPIAGGSVANAWPPISVSVQPAAPTEADSVAIEVTGTLPNPCFEAGSSHVVVGNAIDVVVDVVPTGEEYCPDVLGSIGVTEEIGKLAAGEYLVETTVYTHGRLPCGPLPCSDARTLQVIPESVGGIAQPLELDAATSRAADSSGPSTGVIAGIAAAVAAGALALAGSAWYARRRRG